MAKEIQHRLGGPWTVIKLEILRAYLKSFTTALSPKFDLSYIDAFAGKGDWIPAAAEISESEAFVEPRKGSAAIALENTPPFQEFFFIDLNAAYVEALRDFVGARAGATVICGDANEEVAKICRSIRTFNSVWRPRPKRAVLFLDPYGMAVRWETLKVIAETGAIDLWYLFPINAVLRQAAKEIEKVDSDKKAALTRVLGSSEWEKEFYKPPAQADLFGGGPGAVRDANVAKFEEYVAKKLREIFPWVADPIQLPQTGLQKFSLFFAMSNDSEAAIKLATRIVTAIRKSL